MWRERRPNIVIVINWPTDRLNKSGNAVHFIFTVQVRVDMVSLDASFGNFKQNIKRTMRDRGRESGRRDINCWAIIVGSVEFEGSTDFDKDTEFSAGFLELSERLHQKQP